MKTKFFQAFLLCAFSMLIFSSCDEDDPVVIEDPVASFTATTTDGWNYTFENTSNVTGTAVWDLGNGNVSSGDDVVAYYPLKGDYTVTMTLSTSSGTLEDSKTITIENSDEAYYAHEFFQVLTGGLTNADGKKWLMDINMPGHYGLGPGNGDWSSYHASAGGYRAGYGPDGGNGFEGYYDDELTFILDGMVAKYYTGDDGKIVCRQQELDKYSDHYSNPVDPEGAAGFEYAVDYDLANDKASPLNQGFSVSIEEGAGDGEIDDKICIQFIGDERMYVMFDFGAVDNKWYVDSYDDHHMTLYAAADADYDIDESTTYYQIKLYEDGYKSVPAELSSSATIGDNGTVDFDITNVSGADITSVTWEFGDGTTGEGASVSHSYSSNLTYNAIAKVLDGIGVYHTVELVATITNTTDVEEPAQTWATFDGSDPIEFSAMGNDDGIVDDAGNNVLKSTLSWQWGNTYAGFNGELDLSTNGVVKFKVKGKKGYRLAVNLYNKTDFESAPYGTDAKPLELYYDIAADDTWEEVIMDFRLHPTFDDTNATGFYDDLTIFLNPGAQPSDPNGFVYLDDFKGPQLP